MPVYQITAPDGKTYKISGPPNATQAQVAAAVMAQNPQAGKPVENAGFLGSFGEAATTLAAAPQATAFAANPSDVNR